MAKTANDYFIIGHEGHMGPHDETVELAHYRDYHRFQHAAVMCSRISHGDAAGRARAAGPPRPAGPRLPAPEGAIKSMDAAGCDAVCVVPHWHATWMNVDPKGTSNGWMIQAVEKYPDRLLPGPVFRPSIVGVENTLWEMEYMVKEKGAKYCKIYPPGELWDMNDRRFWPVYARAQELGLMVGFHTGHGYIYGANTHAAHPGHLEDVCREFYDLKILAFHFGWPWHHELNCLAGAYPNLYIGMSFLNQCVVSRPMFFAHLLGESVLYAGVDKVIWGFEGVGSRDSNEAFASFQMPEDLQKGYGYRALTEEDKAKMFGLTFAKLIGVEPKKRVGTTKLPG